MADRITVSGKQLAIVVAIWLRRLPKWVWGKDPEYEKLKSTRRHNADEEPDPKRLAAELIASRIDELGWEVSYEEQGNMFADRTSAASGHSDGQG